MVGSQVFGDFVHGSGLGFRVWGGWVYQNNIVQLLLGGEGIILAFGGVLYNGSTGGDTNAG